MDEYLVSVEMKATYLSRRKADLAHLRQSLRAEDFDAFSRLAHKLKGSADSFGFSSLNVIIDGLDNVGHVKSSQAARVQLLLFERWIESFKNS